MKLADLVPQLRAQKRAPEELAKDFTEATVKATFEEMSQFRVALQREEPNDKKRRDAFQAYTTLVVLFSSKNPQYVKKINEYSVYVENANKSIQKSI